MTGLGNKVDSADRRAQDSFISYKVKLRKFTVSLKGRYALLAVARGYTRVMLLREGTQWGEGV